MAITTIHDTLNTRVRAVETKNTEQDTGIQNAAAAASTAEQKAINAQSRADSAYTLAEQAKNLATGRSKATSFDTVTAMTTALRNAARDAYQIGDQIFIKEQNVPDYWISNVLSSNSGGYGYFELTELEGKIDLTAYQRKVDTEIRVPGYTSIVGSINRVYEIADTNETDISKIKTDIGNMQNVINEKQDSAINIDGLSAHSVEEALRLLSTQATAALQRVNNKVDKVEGKGLSTNDFTDALKAKLETTIPSQIASSAYAFVKVFFEPENLTPSITTLGSSASELSRLSSYFIDGEETTEAQTGKINLILTGSTTKNFCSLKLDSRSDASASSALLTFKGTYSNFIKHTMYNVILLVRWSKNTGDFSEFGLKVEEYATF